MTNLRAGQNTAAADFFGDPDFAGATRRAEPFSPVRRVAMVTESFLPKVDGVVKTAYLSLRYLQDTGREVLVFAPDIAVDAIGESQVIPMPSIGLPQAPETRMALPNPVVARRIEAFQPDLIHLFSPAAMSVSGMAAGRHLNLPVIANYQTDLPGYTEHYGFPRLSGPVNRWLRYIHNGCHLTLAPTRATIRQLRQAGFRRVRHWGRGVDTERFNPRRANPSMRERLLNGRDADNLLCIYVGRLSTEKRIDLLLDVARTPGVALTIIGDGAQREQLEARFAATDAHFTGYLLGEDLAAAYASADVFTFSGEYETFGQVIQEAMASGLPCIVVDAGGAPDVIDHGGCGLVVAPSRRSFAFAARTLRDQPWRRAEMARRARTLAEARPWSALMAQMERYYEEAWTLNQRFARRFGGTRYHQPLSILPQLARRPRSLS